MENNRFSLEITVFHGRKPPEEGTLVGYGALIHKYDLPVPIPEVLSLISSKNRQYTTEQWQVFTPRHLPDETLYKQLVFALKYEGVHLLVLKKLFDRLSEKSVIDMLQEEPTGQYSRRLWFLYEWLLNKQLSIDDLQRGNYVPLINEEVQYALEEGERSGRHRIINNLPGTRDFCPLIRKTAKLENYITADFAAKKKHYLKNIRKDILQRASAFLLLKDSKASFTIEGESPKSKRTARWGQAIGQAGANDLTKDELIRLQQIVIENPRFLNMGFREKGGFVGEHDRSSGEPIPDHISAKWQDIQKLIEGLIATNQLLLDHDEIDAVLAATMVAFGFVFIHPFEDGNGRIHRYLIHHILARKNFAQQGIIFPVSASILDHIDDYRKVLELYSRPLLDFIKWRETKDHNVEVLNDTIDYYQYFDATLQAEFLYDCVHDTIENIIPEEVAYLIRYDAFKHYLDNEFEMPDNMVAMLVRFLEQNNGKLSKRAKEKEFSALKETEVKAIEEHYQDIMLSGQSY
jgi:hypothetical protein